MYKYAGKLNHIFLQSQQLLLFAFAVMFKLQVRNRDNNWKKKLSEGLCYGKEARKFTLINPDLATSRISQVFFYNHLFPCLKFSSGVLIFKTINTILLFHNFCIFFCTQLLSATLCNTLFSLCTMFIEFLKSFHYKKITLEDIFIFVVSLCLCLCLLQFWLCFLSFFLP